MKAPTQNGLRGTPDSKITDPQWLMYFQKLSDQLAAAQKEIAELKKLVNS